MLLHCRLVFLVLATLVVQHVASIDTVPELNITQYLGRWYQVWHILILITQAVNIPTLQVYGNLVVDTFTERNCKCVTADCKLNF